MDRGRKLAVPPLVRRLLTENGLAESPAGPLRCIGRARRSLLRRAQGAVGFGPLLGDVFTPSFSPPSTRRRLSAQNGRALLFPVIALTGGSIAGNGGFVKWAAGFSQGNQFLRTAQIAFVSLDAGSVKTQVFHIRLRTMCERGNTAFTRSHCSFANSHRFMPLFRTLIALLAVGPTLFSRYESPNRQKFPAASPRTTDSVKVLGGTSLRSSSQTGPRSFSKTRINRPRRQRDGRRYVPAGLPSNLRSAHSFCRRFRYFAAFSASTISSRSQGRSTSVRPKWP